MKIIRQAMREGLSRADIELILPPPHQSSNLEPLDDVRPSMLAPIFRAHESGVEMVTARWGLIPWFHKGPVKDFTKRFATFNAKGEELAKKPTWREAFKRRRCLIPADGWYEFKGEKSPKSKFLFTIPGEEWFCFAGLWDRAETTDGPIESFTMVTQAPGTAMRAWHHRAPVVLRPEEWKMWLDLGADVGPILGRESSENFAVERVR